MKTKKNTTRPAPDAHAVEAARQMMTDAILTEDGSIVVAGGFCGGLAGSCKKLYEFVYNTAAECKDYAQYKRCAKKARGMMRDVERDTELALAACLNQLGVAGGGR